MENPHIIREKALRLAVRTGIAPDLDFVWRWQKEEGCEMCFGSFTDTCPLRCRWYGRCKSLWEEPLDYPWPIPREATNPQN